MTDIPSMVERVARAICLAEGLMPDNKYRSGRDDADTAPHLLQWHHYQPEARAAIEAMREPTRDMAIAGWEDADHTLESMSGDAHPNVLDSCRNIYRTMIDKALNGGEG